jgi:hypothetical protein
VALDERLRRAIDDAGEPADPSGVYEDLIRRRERRRLVRRVRAGGLTLVVIGTTALGIFALSRVFIRSPEGGIAGTSVGNGRIAFVEVTEVANGQAASAIASMNPDGSDPKRLFETPGFGSISGLDWSPDGTRLAFAASAEPDGPSLYVMNQDGSNLHRVIGTALSSDVSWSPDGTRLAYVDEWKNTVALFTIGLDGGEPHRLTGEDQYVATPDWSPDGEHIAYASEAPHVEPELIDIYVVDLKTLAIHRLTEDPALDYEPEWSPDGTRILFRSRRDDVLRVSAESQAPDEIYVMNSDGSGQTRLTHDSATDQSAVWSPDGSQIAYTSQGPGPKDEARIVIMGADGSHPLASSFGGSSLAWQPLVMTDGATSPSTSPSPTGSTVESPAQTAVEDIGLGFPVCNVSSIEGHFATPNSKSTALVATKAGDLGDCPQPEDAFNVVALDVDGDGLADTSYGPIECTLECRTFSAPELDADGTAELLIVQSGGSILGLGLFDVSVRESEPVLEPVTVASPGDPAGGFEPGEVVRLLLGGDEFYLDTLRCGDPDMRHGPGLIVTTAESLPHDSPDARWHAHTTVFALVDESLQVMDIGDFTEPAGVDAPSFQSGEMLCGSNLGP